jgi:excisionase family DNA binding protein
MEKTNENIELSQLLLTPKHAAELLAISRSRLYELMGQGAIYYVKIGRSTRIPLEELRRWVAELLAAGSYV